MPKPYQQGRDEQARAARSMVGARSEVASGAEAALLGAVTCDVYLNEAAHWRNLPAEVWGFTIGGYQVLKKWLSYREEGVLGRPLSPAEVQYVRDVARRLAALRLLGPALDASYRACAAAHVPLETASA